MPERRQVWWAIVAAALVGSLLLADRGTGVRILVNSLAGLVLLLATAWALGGARNVAPSRAGRAAAVFVLVGAAVVVWRVVARIGGTAPAAAGPTASDALVFLFLVLAAMFLSMVFVLMHAERAYATLHREASLDALTGALARGALQEQGERLLKAARRHQRPLSALLLDLDRFKDVNDRLGHDAGDAVLRHLAARAKGVLRGEDVLCRLGGDEFVALLPQTDAQGACVVAERLRQSLAETPLSIRGLPVPVPISIGVARRSAAPGRRGDVRGQARRRRSRRHRRAAVAAPP
jgi:diguanylate cyclase (GGDEF)-like protein